MWHIVKKVSEKVGVSLNADKEFNSDFKSCVWRSESPDDFEETWKSIIVRSTKAEELLADNDSIRSAPKLKLDRDLEKHGSNVYTHENFYIFQNELWIECSDCGVENKKEEDGKEVLHVIDNSQANGKIREVVYNPSDHNANCSCNMFQSLGIPCRHILCVLKDKGLNEIPSNYIVNRWTKLANIKPIFDISNVVLESSSKPENESKLISDAWDNFLRCMDKVGQSKEKLLVVINGTIDIEKQLIEFEGDTQQSKTDDLQAFIGSNIPKEVDILPPQFSKTKGSGKRIKGGKDKAIQQQQKRTRLCKACSQHTFHDSRNCPLKSSP
ncbi:Zinc finger, PMZ-type [Sesbania bispinosa]|nr:Zinc finger, PMZ-type [Sesbania bispinosa]